MDDSYRRALDSAITAMLREAVERARALSQVIAQIDRLVALRVRMAEQGESRGGTCPDAGGVSDSAVAEVLTRRERQVVEQLVGGRSNRQIARSLDISERTVKNHLHGIFTKLGVTDRTSAAVKMLRLRGPHPGPRRNSSDES